MRLHSDATGEGPPLVLIGSLGSSVEMWAPQLPALSAFSVIRIDLPGHGGSPVPGGQFSIADIGRAVLAHVHGRFSVCGISLGGLVAMWLAANADVDRAVLACTKPRFGPSELWQERARLVRRDGIEAIADSILARWFVHGEPPGFREMLLACPPEGYARCCEALRDADLQDELGRIDASALVIVGEHDATVTIDDVRGLPGRLVTVDAGHLASADAPDDFNAVLLEHLA